MMKVVSSEPSEFSLARKSHWVDAVAPLAWNDENWPPRSIWRLGRIVIAITLPFASGSNVVSSEPSELRRAMQLRTEAEAAPLGWIVENPPPTTIWPGGSTAIEG